MVFRSTACSQTPEPLAPEVFEPGRRQLSVADSVLDWTALSRGEHVLYVLPTGGGKTIVATSITERAVERWTMA
jgi:superfamily II DNA or RNA helicase